MMTREKNFAIDIAYKAGELMMKDFTLGMKKEWKRDNTPLTKTDIKVNRLVMKMAKEKFPDYNVLAEEESFFSKNAESSWVCDPLDGTVAFSHGIPTFTFSLALTRRGETVLGVVYDPFLNRMFFAEKGRGAFLNNKKISVSSKNNLNNSVMGVIWTKKHRFDLLNLLKALKDKNVKTINVGSVAYLGALVAAGEFAAVISGGSKIYDIAALKIIVEEAGGKVTDIFGLNHEYDKEANGYLITNNLLHEKLTKLAKINARINPVRNFREQQLGSSRNHKISNGVNNNL